MRMVRESSHSASSSSPPLKMMILSRALGSAFPKTSISSGFAQGFDRFTENLGDIDPWKMNEIRAWFRRNSDEPCFLFIHTYQIHDPYLPPSPYDEIFSSEYQGWVVGDKNKLRTSARGAGFDDLYHAFWRTNDANPDPASVGPDDLRQLVALYDGGIRYTDDVLHGFFEDLRQDGLLDNTLVVVFSDFVVKRSLRLW